MNMVRNTSFHGTCVMQSTSLPVAPLGMFVALPGVQDLIFWGLKLTPSAHNVHVTMVMHIIHLVVYVPTLMLTHTCTCTHTYIQVLHVHTHGQH